MSCLLIVSHNPAHAELNIIPPFEVTPEIVAMRGCIEGVAHPSELDLTTEAQLAACDDHVTLAEDRIGAVGIRGLTLYDIGTTDDHRAQAFTDFTEVIEARGDASPSVYANRAFVTFKRKNRLDLSRSELDLALADITRAIEIIEATAARPRPYYFERRAMIYGTLFEKRGDRDYIVRAIADMDHILTLQPDSPRTRWMKAIFVKYLPEG
ncbi:hypothetical protein [Jannaschia donghaensis]|uniref:hypothetical protein n=1 Tax=Jannaschia donghaensis TaxID=420998 RepID=UPI00118760F5|nr:hypothetical protein [Jannaschia donghaensis]